MKTQSGTQCHQRAAQHLLASLVPAHLAPTKPFAYVVSRTNDDNPFKGALPRVSFVADGVEFVKSVLAAMQELGYQTGFAVFVQNRSFEIVARMPETI